MTLVDYLISFFLYFAPWVFSAYAGYLVGQYRGFVQGKNWRDTPCSG